MTSDTRIVYLDHTRAFLFLLMVLDHALHAYAQHWGYFWFFRDHNRALSFDYLYLFNQAIIMPGLFFIMGLFIVPSFQKRGWSKFIKEKLIRLGIPFVLFIPITVPLLCFPRYETYERPGITYLEFFTEVFWNGRLQAGPLWVMQAMFFYSLAIALIFRGAPALFNSVKKLFSWMEKNPKSGIPMFILISFLWLVGCDLRWGAPWWIKLFSFLTLDGQTEWNQFLQLFSVQASRSLWLFWYALSGAAIMQLGWLRNQAFMQRFVSRTSFWILGTIAAGIVYTHFSMHYFHEGAYNESVRIFLENHGPWYQLPALIVQESLLVIIRNLLLAVLTFFQLTALISIFYNCNTKNSPFWNKMASGAYTLFLTHETFVVWMQYALNGTPLPTFIKFALTFTVGFSVSWWLTHSVLLKFKPIRRVLRPENQWPALKAGHDKR